MLVVTNVSNDHFQLVLPATTRWCSLKNCFQSLLDSEEIIFAVVNARDFISHCSSNQRDERAAVKSTVSDPSFVWEIGKMSGNFETRR